jgi:hypothetical protein
LLGPQFSVKGRIDVMRQKGRVGDFGEEITVERLKKAGYTDIYRLPPRFQFYDIIAVDPAGERLAIDVKCRNRLELKGGLNKWYFLFRNRARRATALEVVQAHGLSYRWVTVQIDVLTRTYYAHIGTLDDVDAVTGAVEHSGVPMGDKGATIGTLLGEGKDNRICPGMSNK